MLKAHKDGTITNESSVSLGWPVFDELLTRRLPFPTGCM